MPVRVVCNVVYAHIVSRIESEEDREKFDGELYARPGQRNVSIVDQVGG